MLTSLKIRAVILFLVGVVAIVGSLAAVGAFQYLGLMNRQSEFALGTAQSVQKYFLLGRAQQLEDASNIVARDPSFAGYIAHAFGDESASATIDTASIRDLIGERREDLKADVVAILSVDGKVIVASGDAQPESLSLSGNSILDRAKKTDESISGFLVQDKRLLLITCTTIRRGADIQAILFTGQKIDANTVAEASRLSNAGLALVQKNGTSWQVAMGNIDDRASRLLPETMQHLASSQDVQSAVGSVSDNLNSGDGVWVVRATRLEGSEGNLWLVSSLPPSFRAGILQTVTLPLIFAGAILLFLLLIFSVILWTKIGKPLAHLADLSARATKGDHALEFKARSSGAVGRVGAGFNYLMQELGRHRVPSGTPMRRATDRHVR